MSDLQLPVYRYESCSSTSSIAQELLASGKCAPFLVIAETQAAGRGQHGKSWQSPRGNLYMSLVLPPPADSTMIATLPLRVAFAIARYVQLRLGLRLTVKWPNDLLFGAKKLGGILCESSSQGAQWGPVVIGLGLNIVVAPDVDEQESAALKQILPDAQLAPEVLANDLARAIQAELRPEHKQLLLDDYLAFGLEAGQLVQSEQGWQSIRGLCLDGSLKLAAQAITSAAGTRRWLYQDPEQPIVVADCGNSAVKLALFKTRNDLHPALQLSSSYSELSESCIALRAALPRTLAAMPYPLHYGSVAPAQLGELIATAVPSGLQPLSIPKRPLRLRTGPYPLQQLGIDRLAALEAVAAEPGRRVPTIIISCGTATTIDVLLADHLHLGGLILAGLETQTESLHASTGLLPQLSRAEIEATWQHLIPRAPLGQGTVEAMIGATMHATLGTIERVQTWLRGECGQRPRLRLTGGWAPTVANALGLQADPELVVRGLRLLALGG